MNRKEIEKEVENWLEMIYGKGKVPSYDGSDECLSHLLTLSKLYSEEEKSLAERKYLQQHQIAEYRQEAKRMQNALGALGLGQVNVTNQSSLNLEDDVLDSVIDILATTAESLGVDDASEQSIDLALVDIRLKTSHLPVETFMQKCTSDQNKSAMLDELKSLNRSEKALANAKKEATIDDPTIIQLRKKFAFMQEKHREYVKTQEKYSIHLKKTGYKRNISHDAIVTMHKNMDKLEQELKPLKGRLEGYHGLPPSIELAQAKVSEMEQLLESLTEALTKEISMLQV